MKKIWQKSLASMVSAALCLTAFVGCLTVSATTGRGSFTVVNQTAKPGSEVVVPIEITSDEASQGLAAAIFDVTFDTNVLTPVTVESPAGVDYVSDYRAKDGEGVDVKEDGNGLGTMRALAWLADGKNDPVESMIVNITFTVADTAAIGDTAITLSNYQACNYGTVDAEGIWADDEDLIAMSATDGKVTVCEHTNATYDYSVVDGNCITKLVCPDCGNEEVVATVASKTVTPNPVLASGLSIRFRVKQSDVVDYTDLYGTFTKDTYDGDTYAGESAADTILAVSQGKNWQFEYTGIASYEMTCTIHIAIYASDNNGNIVLVASTDYALADFFKSRLATSGVYSDANMNLYADILRYGAESQKVMGYHTDALANDGVTTSYGTELPTTFTNTESVPSGSIDIKPTVVVGNSVRFRIRFAQDSISAYDFNNVKMTIDYVNSYGNSDTEVGTSDMFTSATNGQNWQYEFANLPCASINDYFVIKIYDGETELASYKYSFQSYALSRYTGSQTNATLCQAIVAYSNSAKTAFFGL